MLRRLGGRRSRTLRPFGGRRKMRRRGCSRRRGPRRWRYGFRWRRWRFGRGRRGSGLRRRGVRRRCALRRLLFALLVLGLRHHHRRGLCVRGRTRKVHRRKSGRGKQHETKFGHDDVSPRQIIENKIRRSTNKRWAGLWRPSQAACFLFLKTEPSDAPAFIAHSGDHFNGRSLQWCVTLSPAAGQRGSRGQAPIEVRKGLTPQWTRLVPAALDPADRAPGVRQACCPVILPGAAARPDPASAVAPQAADFPAGFPVAAPTAAPA
jgi:hypothetical protein